MATRQALERRISSTQDMSSIVSTMKSLAAVNVRVFGRARDSLLDYSTVVERALQVLLRENPGVPFSGRTSDAGERVAFFVFGAVQGMCAQFTDHIAEHSVKTARRYGGELSLVAVGPRVGPRLTALGMEPEREIPLGGSLDELPRVVDDCIVAVEQMQSAGISRIILCYNQDRRPSYQPHHEVLLPVDLSWIEEVRERNWPSNQLPVLLDADYRFVRALFRQYIFVRLYRAAAESLAAENAVRLSSMQSAENNIEERLGELEQKYNQQRQQEITAELLDIVGGYTTLEES